MNQVEEESIYHSLEEEAIDVGCLLMEPRCDQLSVNNVWSYEENNTGKCIRTEDASYNLDSNIHTGYVKGTKLNALDVLPHKAGMENLLLTSGVSPCDEYLLDLGYVDPGGCIDYVSNEGLHVGNFCSQSQFPMNGSFEIRNSLTESLSGSECQNYFLNSCNFGLSTKSSESKIVDTFEDFSKSFIDQETNEDTQFEQNETEITPFCQDVPVSSAQDHSVDAPTNKRSRKPTKRYIDESSLLTLISCKKRKEASSVSKVKNKASRVGRPKLRKDIEPKEDMSSYEISFGTAIQVPFISQGSTECEKNNSPRLKNNSARQSNNLPPQKNNSLRQKNNSPCEKNNSPPQKNSSPHQKNSLPLQKNSSPPHKNNSPPQKNSSPPQKNSSPLQKNSSPPHKNSSPPHKNSSPPQKNSSPPQKLSSPPQKLSSPPQKLSSPPQKINFSRQRNDLPPQRNKSPQKNNSAPQKKNSPPPIERHFENYTSESEEDDSERLIRSVASGNLRKHHKVWSVSEVKKLIDGVAQFGVGKWTHIKKLLFASSAHRSSVDLKDKWRNLLKASQALKGDSIQDLHKRNQPWRPLPKPILCRVIELASVYPYPRENNSKTSKSKFPLAHHVSSPARIKSSKIPVV